MDEFDESEGKEAEITKEEAIGMLEDAIEKLDALVEEYGVEAVDAHVKRALKRIVN